MGYCSGSYRTRPCDRVTITTSNRKFFVAAASRYPAQTIISQFVDPRQFAVFDNHITFRDDAFGTFFNPTNSTPPFFQIFDQSFLNVLGVTPAIYEISSNDTFAFAHEAPIYVSDTDTVYFASNDGGALGMSDLDHNNQVGFISIKDTEAKISSLNGTFSVNVPVSVVSTANVHK